MEPTDNCPHRTRGRPPSDLGANDKEIARTVYNAVGALPKVCREPTEVSRKQERKTRERNP